MDTLTGGTKGLARTGSGLIVPAGLADSAKVATGTVVRDIDGRRRVVFTDSERRTIDRARNTIRQRGFSFIIGCVGVVGTKHPDGSPVCGQVMEVEGKGTDDAGYGCRCSRIHFIRT